MVERDGSGAVRVTDEGDNVAGSATAAGSLIGSLVGVLGGPLGVLLGLSTGAVGGAFVDADRLDKSDAALAQFANTVPSGGNAILAETVEEDVSLLDDFVAQGGGVLVRRATDEVIDELEAQEEATEEAAHAARKALHAQHKAERKENHHERIEALKAKLHHEK